MTQISLIGNSTYQQCERQIVERRYVYHTTDGKTVLNYHMPLWKIYEIRYVLRKQAHTKTNWK